MLRGSRKGDEGCQAHLPRSLPRAKPSCHFPPTRTLHTNTLPAICPLSELAWSGRLGMWKKGSGVLGQVRNAECSAVRGKHFVLCVSIWGQLEGNCDREERLASGSPSAERAGDRAHLSLVFLLFLLQGQLYEHLLQLLVAVVDHELLKAVILEEKEGGSPQTLPPSPAPPVHREPVPLSREAGR